MSTKLKTIPLAQLKRSKANVRKTERLADIEQLAASIEANGLLENLVVHAVANGKNGPRYDVVAGGRRLAALKLLAKRKKIDPAHSVPCLVIDDSPARTVEVSLAENFVRAPVHPADQCEAFAALCRQGLSVDDIAGRFGIAPRFVEQRLKLAAVSPRLIAEYRQGAMTLDQLTAFTLTDDHAQQEEVWFERPYEELPAQTIRRLLTKTQVDGNDPRARFVGVNAYETAGGVILRDLFDAEDEGYFTDSRLLDRLVAEKLGAVADEVRAEGWQWVEIHAGEDSPYLGRFGRVPTCEIALCPEEEDRLSTLSARYDELVAALEEDDNGETASELDAISAEIDRLQQKQEGWSDDAKGRAGAIVRLGPDGTPEVVRGLLKPDANGHDAAGNDHRRPRPKTRAKADGYSESIVIDLSAHRTAALRECLAQKPETALLALLHALVDRVFYDGPSASCLDISIREAELERLSDSVGGSKAGQTFAARHTAWRDKLPERAACWSWLESLASTERLHLLAHCVSLSVNALERHFGRVAGGEAADALAIAAELDMRDWWRPTQTEFLGRLTKNEILAAVSEGVSQRASARLAGLKKARMAKEAEKLLAETGWLPLPLRSSTPADAISVE